MTTETRNKVLERDGYTCQRCGTPLSSMNAEIAHRICNSRAALKWIQRYAMENYQTYLSNVQAQDVLDHPHNLRTACRYKKAGSNCNDSFNCFNNPEEASSILEMIFTDIGIIKN